MNERKAEELRVIFVEDAETDVELAVLELERDGFIVQWERVELEADLREALTKREPQVVLSDYTMPQFNGLMALQIVHELTPHIPFIFISGTIGEERAIESIRQGATDYVLKGNMRRLATAVRRALSDATERARAQLAEEARARLATILEATSDFVAISDPQGLLIYTNTALRELTDLSEEEITKRNIYNLHAPWAQTLIEKQGIRGAAKNGVWQGETALVAADGTEIPVSQVIIAHRNDDGEITYFSTIARDIRERKAYEQRIQHLANYDGLTDLPNRALLADRLAQATTHLRRGDRSLALLVIDVDRFKLVNDGFGQEAGDRLLKMVGERLCGIVRAGDTVARLGADAFGVLATDLARPDDVITVVNKIQESTRAPVTIDGNDIHISVSVGASICPRDGEDFAVLLRNADAAMHRAKADHPGSFQFYAEEMTRDASDRVDMENALRRALTQEKLELHYQPQVIASTGAISGVEALMRWTDSKHGSVSPGIFIPIAEHSDLILDIGEWALWTACRQLKQWNGIGNGLRMSVNVSARQFRNAAFPELVARAIHGTDIDPARLELELTESVLVEDQDAVQDTLARINALGVQISIDDFGTGYSSLRYLSRLSFGCLKIDRSFMLRALEDPHDAAIVQAIMSLASSLKKRVIAEGVETLEQLAFLRKLGEPEIQGFLFSRPIPVEAATGLLQRGILMPGAADG